LIESCKEAGFGLRDLMEKGPYLMRGPISFAPVIEQGGFEGGVEQDRGQVLGRSRVLFKEVRVRSNKISRKKCPKLVDRGKRNVQEREREKRWKN